MILINNQEIIEVTNTSNLDEVFQSYEFCFSDIPFVEILRDNKDSYKCIIGYINIKTKEKIDADIMIKNIKITKIEVIANEVRMAYYSDHLKTIDFKYKIHTILYDHNIEYTSARRPKEHIFMSSELITFDNGRINNKGNNPIALFFQIIVPELNRIIEKDIETKKINFRYFDTLFSQKCDTDSDLFSITLNDVLDMIYYVNIEIENHPPHAYSNDDVTCYIIINSDDNKIANYYLSNLLGQIIESELHVDEIDNHIQYKGKLLNLPCYTRYDADSLKRFLQRKLYFHIFEIYNQEEIIEGFKYQTSSKRYKEEALLDYKVRALLNFILSIKATCFEDGENRVGRDDRGWLEYTVLFSAEYNYIPNEFLLNLINNELNIKLDYKENELCYFCQYQTAHEYIAGMARRKDYGSEELQRKYLHKLLIKIIPLLHTENGKRLLLEC